ncbi:unnamed protein product [Rotaria sp. Silwood2]|nr:unnamed protein product [Rotaria sp. Silwood2]
MSRTKGLSRYNEEERKIIMNDNEEKFLYEHKDQSKATKSKKFHAIIRTYMENGNQKMTQNNYKHDSTTSSEQS